MGIQITNDMTEDQLYEAFGRLKNVLITTTKDKKVTKLFTRGLSKVRFQGDGAVKELDIEVSSVEEDDKVLLHKLLERTRAS